MRDYQRFERVVLSQMLVDAQAVTDALDRLQATDFRLSSHRMIFAAIESLREAGSPIDLVTVEDALRKRRQSDEIGGFAYLSELMMDSARDYDIRHHIDQVLESSALFRLQVLCAEVQEAIAEGNTPSGVLTLRLETTSKAVEQDTQPEEMTEIAELMPRVLNRILVPESRLPPLSTGMRGVDTLTLGGIRPKELWVWGGLPKRGKSSAARQVGRSVASAGYPVDIFTIEMPEDDWGELDVAAEAGVPAWMIRRNVLRREHRQALLDAGERMAHWSVRYEDHGTLHIRKLIAKARVSVARRGTRLFIVDYLQRIKSDDKEIRIRVGNVAEALAEFAKEYACSVLLLSQLSRKGDVNMRPSMQDLKESGDVEAHAHCVLLNYRPVNKDANSDTVEEFTGEDEIIVAAQRNGPMGSAKVRYNPDFLMFEER